MAIIPPLAESDDGLKRGQAVISITIRNGCRTTESGEPCAAAHGDGRGATGSGHSPTRSGCRAAHRLSARVLSAKTSASRRLSARILSCQAALV